jgi:hypothetical protein
MKSLMENKADGIDWKRMNTGNSKGHSCSNFAQIQSQRQEKEITKRKKQSKKLPFRYHFLRQFQEAHQENTNIGLLPQSSISERGRSLF